MVSQFIDQYSSGNDTSGVEVGVQQQQLSNSSRSSTSPRLQAGFEDEGLIRHSFASFNGNENDESVDLSSRGASLRASSVSTQSFKIPRKPLFSSESTQFHPLTADGSVSEVSTKTFRARPMRQWGMEFCAVVLSVAALLAVIGVLIHEDGKPLATWTASLSLNTVVSILGVISYTSMAFAVNSCVSQEKWSWIKKRPNQFLAFRVIDDASRGPWGSIKLIFSLKLRHLATLGAITTIILLGFNPFLQAVISYGGSLDTVGQGIESFVSASTRLDAGIYRYDEAGPIGVFILPSPYNKTVSTFVFSSQPDMGMSAALFNGFDDPKMSAKSSPTFTCRTGNCTWPMFTSLAVCSSCNDVSPLVVRKRAVGDGREFHPSNTLIVNSSYSVNLLHDLSFSNLDGKTLSTGGKDYYGVTIQTAHSTGSHNETITFRGNLNMITSLLVMKAGDDYINGKESWENTSISATECALYFCTNLYQSAMVNGELRENVLANWSRRNMDSYLPKLTPGLYLPEINESQAWMAATNYELVPSSSADILREDLQLYIDEEDIKQFVTSVIPALKFNVTQAAVCSMIAWIQNSFFTTGKLLWGLDGPVNSAPAVSEALRTTVNLTTVFSNAAQSMTNWIRNNGASPQQGTTQQWVIHIKVQWVYLVVPGITILAGSLFTLFSILETRRLQLPSWKSDALATMVYGLDDEQRELLKQVDESEDMDKICKRLSMKLEGEKRASGLRAQSLP